MLRVALCLALAPACGAISQAARPHRPIPVAAHVVDLVLFSAGSIVAVHEHNTAGSDRLAAGGLAVALAVWASWWLTEGE